MQRSLVSIYRKPTSLDLYITLKKMSSHNDDMKKAAEGAFSNTARLATGTAGSDASATSSRRSPSLIKNKSDATLFDTMSSATSVVLSKRKNSKKSSTPVSGRVDDLMRGMSADYPQGMSIMPSKNLDFANNDNSFHVIADLLVDFFKARIVKGQDKLLLQPADQESVERLLPAVARGKFIAAVQFRLGYTPSVPTTPLQFLTLQCQELGLDQDDESNPLICLTEMTTDPVLIEVLPLAVLSQAISNKVVADTTATVAANSISATMVTGKQRNVTPAAPAAAALPKLANLHEDFDTDNQSLNSIGYATDARSVNTTMTNTESLVRRQLLAELREASNLMAESITPETAKFWRDHVMDLQARLRALHGEAGSVGGFSQTSPTPDVILEKNRRLVSEYQEREQYVPPVLNIGTKTAAGKIAETSSSNRDVKAASDPPQSQNSIEQEQQSVEGSGGPDGQHAPIVDVVAPADLPGGYRFEAEIEGKRFLAVVPAGGVGRGDTFSCYMRELDSVVVDIPVGYWKDGIFGIFKLGCCHPVVWNSIFCPLRKCPHTLCDVVRIAFLFPTLTHTLHLFSIVMLAQITSRVNLDFIGRPKDEPSALSNRSMMTLVTFFWLFMNAGLFGGYYMKLSTQMPLSVADIVALVLVNGAMLGFTVFTAQSTRSSIRDKFMIRENCCYDLEDLSCATCCLPCTISHMARHTADYSKYDAACCSENGLPDGVKLNKSSLKDEDADNYHLV